MRLLGYVTGGSGLLATTLTGGHRAAPAATSDDQPFAIDPAAGVNNRRLLPTVDRELVLRLLLAVLTYIPLISLFLALAFRLVPMQVSTVVLLATAYLTLPALVATLTSQPRSMIARDLPKYALCALVPFTVYNISRAPLHPLLGTVYWDLWFTYGNGATGQPMNQWGSLVTGTLMHSLQGWALAMGFYILFKPSLRNCLLYGFVFLSTNYSFFFPTFVYTDFQPGIRWYFMVWWAHLFFALGLWATPKALSSQRIRRWLKNPLVVVAVLLLYIYPYAYLFYRAGTWQFPTQEALDRQAMDQLRVTLMDAPRLVSINPLPAQAQVTAAEARYTMSVAMGSRTYSSYLGAPRSLDVGPLSVRGYLVRAGTVIAVCSAFRDDLGSTHATITYSSYIARVRELDTAELALDCRGPAEAATALVEMQQSGRPVTVATAWTAEVHVQGARVKEDRTYEGAAADVPLQIADEVMPLAAVTGPGPSRPE